jgi:hypothetical protein
MTPTAGPLDPYDPDTVGRRHGGPDVWGQRRHCPFQT